MKLAVVLVFAAVLCAVTPAIVFETKPRVVAPGRDAVLAVRASGALSLLKVHERNLWLQTSFDGGDTFEEPVQVNDIPGEVSSHHESSPQMHVRSRSEFYVLWQTRRAGSDGTVLRFARSLNWGESFSKAIDIDGSTQAPSQSFFTMNVGPDGAIYAVWLDGRDRDKGAPGTSALYVAKSTNRGVSFEKPVRIALGACPCCRPAITFRDAETIHVAWRRVTEGSIRDIFVSTSTDGGSTWGGSVRVAEDNWKINGCPHSGAAVAVLGSKLYVAWTTVREGRSQLYLTSSDDAGKTFTARARVANDTADPNHPYLSNRGDRLALIFQGRDPKENQGWGTVKAFHREIGPDGTLSPLTKIANAGKSVSYPAFAFGDPDRVFVAWTEPGDETQRIVLARGRIGAPVAEVGRKSR